MKTVAEIFADCAKLVAAQFPKADPSEQLKAAVALVDLTMKGIVEAFNEKLRST